MLEARTEEITRDYSHRLRHFEEQVARDVSRKVVGGLLGGFALIGQAISSVISAATDGILGT